ncbi:hypothetical protein H5410_002368 [Solanum commersonii]|uniref:Uncharacterized protein n=1 Tax=Solanum commersonii TaxID=4109 RepID=A0A9J6B246_SOLCO|nr:hypothetical protein H5410_002368 [Solanum commersonii]
MNELYHTYHICYTERIEQIYFFIEFLIPWIHKWTQEMAFTDEQIPSLYRTFYNNFWHKLMKRDPKTKLLYGQELLDLIKQRIQEYCLVSQKGIIQDSSVRHIARKISIHDGNKENMINNYLDKVRKNILLNINQYEKSDTSMRSETSDAVSNIQVAQLCEPTTEDMLEKAEDLLCKLKGKDHGYETFLAALRDAQNLNF